MKKNDRGSVLIEFALVSLVLSMILAATIDFGAMFLTANIVQSAARSAAASLSIKPAANTATSFEELRNDPDVLTGVYDPALLVIPVPRALMIPSKDFDDFIATLPSVNGYLLRTLMMEDVNSSDDETRVFRYPGALPSGSMPDCNPNPTDPPYAIPVVTHPDGVHDAITGCVNVIEGSLLPPDPMTMQRTIDVWINYPYQAAALSSFRLKDPAEVSNIVRADGEFGPYEASDSPLPGETAGPYSGPNQLGHQYAFAKGPSVTVRPYRRLLTGNAREKVNVIMP